jgi:predicted phage tail component-like protein
MVWGFTYDGISSASKNIEVLNVKGRGIMPEVESKTMDIASKHGSHYYGHRYRSRKIEIDIVLQGTSMDDFRAKVRDLASWLNPEGAPYNLIFDDETDKQYKAVLTNETDFEQFVKWGKGTLHFLCPDPFAYDTTNTVANFNNDSVTVNNTGTFKTFPIFTVTFSAAANELKIEKNANEFIRIIRNFVQSDQVVIDCEKGNITLNGNTNLLSSLDIDSEFFALDVGNNIINITPTGVSTASISFTKRWL